MIHVCNVSEIRGDRRKHIEVQGRIVTVLTHKGTPYCFDTVCYHAGGPLGKGLIEDIEEVGASCVKCPWHSYCVALDTGERVFQSCEMVDGKLQAGRWKRGPVQQRIHTISVREDGAVFIILNDSPEHRQSDDYSQAVDEHKFGLAKRMMEAARLLPDGQSGIHSGRILNPSVTKE